MLLLIRLLSLWSQDVKSEHPFERWANTAARFVQRSKAAMHFGEEQIMGCLDFEGSYSYEASFSTEKMLFQQILRHCIMRFYRCVLQTGARIAKKHAANDN